MAIIPVELVFSGVAQNYDLSLTITTQEVTWSLGGAQENYLGISYNALTLDRQHMSCIQKIEVSGSTLRVSTGSAVGSDFALTAFIDVPENVRWLQGRCILNEKARVLARLGYFAPIDWSGEINCAIPVLLAGIHRATFTVRGIKQGQPMRIHLASADAAHDEVRWCVAPIINPEVGLWIRSGQDNRSLPISAFRANSKYIEWVVADTAKQSGLDVNFVVEAYVELIRQCRYCPPATSVQMKMDADASVSIVARIGNHRPQYLAQAYKLFAL